MKRVVLVAFLLTSGVDLSAQQPTPTVAVVDAATVSVTSPAAPVLASLSDYTQALVLRLQQLQAAQASYAPLIADVQQQLADLTAKATAKGITDPVPAATQAIAAAKAAP